MVDMVGVWLRRMKNGAMPDNGDIENCTSSVLLPPTTLNIIFVYSVPVVSLLGKLFYLIDSEAQYWQVAEQRTTKYPSAK